MLCSTAANWVLGFDKFRSFISLANKFFGFRWLVMENTAQPMRRGVFGGGAAPERERLPLQDFPSEVLIKNPFGCTMLVFFGGGGRNYGETKVSCPRQLEVTQVDQRGSKRGGSHQASTSCTSCAVQ